MSRGIKILGTQGWEKLGGKNFFSFKQGGELTLDDTMLWWEAVKPPYGSPYKSWWRPGGKAPGSSKDLVLWNQLLLIKMYSPQPVMKLIQHIFSKILPKFEFEIIFGVQLYASLNHKGPMYL